MLNPNAFALIQHLIEIIGTLAFAVSGLVAGLKRQMDIVGVTMVAGLTAFGGGTLRDILLDRHPLYWIDNAHWLWIILLMVLVAMRLLKNRHMDYTLRMIEVPDAVGLALFTIVGMQVALAQQLPSSVCVLMGVMTACFGGVLRDVACAEKPQLFFDHKPYASVAFLGGVLYLLMLHFLQMPLFQELIAFLVIVSLRLFAVYRGWQLPKSQL